MSKLNYINMRKSTILKNKLYFTSKQSKIQDNVLKGISQEQSTIGYYSLPNQDIAPILEFSSNISDEIENIAVIGIGGSSLGSKAIYEFLKPTQKLKRELYFFESTDPINIKSTLEKIDIKKTHFLVISKSGTTVETFALYKYIYSLHTQIDAFTFITDENSKLEKYAHSVNAKYLNLPSNVGGRFSVLSVVGLLPLVLCGIDIEKILAGARNMKESFFDKGYISDILLDKAIYYAKNHEQYNINCIFGYSESLKYFNDWYVQLWGESLGKYQLSSVFNVGLTPIGLIGPKDQHSFLQLLAEGTRNKSVTFIKISDFEDDMKIPNISLPNLESLDILNDIPFSKLINMQCDAITESLNKTSDIPIDVITLSKVNEDAIGGLIYYYELLTSLVAKLININAYDQPGVEAGKIILKRNLANSV